MPGRCPVMVGYKSLPRPFARWSVIARWLVPGDLSARCVFFIGRLAGGRWVGRGKPGDRCPVASGRCTPLGTSTQGVATNMGFSPASTAMCGSAPMFIFPLF